MIPYLDGTSFGFNLRIADLTVVNDNRKSASASRRRISPTNALGEFGIRVGEEKLSIKIQYTSPKR